MTEVIRLSNIGPDDFPEHWFELANESHFWFKARAGAFHNQLKALKLPLNKNWKGIEIGCGNGLVRNQLESFSSWETDGADIQINALIHNTSRKGNTYLYNIHEKHSEFKDKYDFIVLFDVLEHIPDTTEFLNSVLFHLKPGGYLFLNVPALNHLKSKYDEVVGHIRRYDKNMMANEFKNMPVKVIDQRFWALSLVPLLYLRLWFGKKTGSTEEIVNNGMKPPSKLMNQMMEFVLSSEQKLFKNPTIGASLLTCIQKN